jgi:hypothetical protein
MQLLKQLTFLKLTIERLASINQKPEQDYPIIQKKSKFKQRLIEFWIQLIVNLKDTIYDCKLLEQLIPWLASFSCIRTRPFRHTCTVISNTIMTGLCEMLKQLNNEQSKLQPKTKRNNVNLDALINEIQRKQSILKSLIISLCDSVFIHRCRDTDPLTRADCIEELGKWLDLWPEYFIDFVKYLGWAMDDAIVPVRLNALNGILVLFKAGLTKRLRSFFERYKERLLQIAQLDKDLHCRQTSIKILIKMNNEGFLEDIDYDKFVVLILDHEPKIRKLVSPVIAEWAKNEFIDPLINTYDETRTTYSKYPVELKGYCQMAIKLTELTIDSVGNSSGLNTSNEIQKKPVKCLDATLVMFESDRELLKRWIAHLSSNYMVKSEYIKEIAHLTCFEILSERDFESLAELITNDLSNTDFNNVQFDEIEELVLVITFSALIMFAIDTSENASSRNDKDYQDKASNCLIRYIHKLITKYAKEHSDNGVQILVQLIQLCNYLDLETLGDLGLEQVLPFLLQEFENLCVLLSDIIKSHHQRCILDKASGVLEKFTGLNFKIKEKSLSNFNNIAITKMEILTEDIFTRLNNEINFIEKVDKKTEKATFSLNLIRNDITRLRSISSRVNIFSGEFALYSDYYRVLNGSLEGCLQFLKYWSEEQGKISFDIEVSCTEIMKYSTQILCSDLVNQIQILANTTESKPDLITLVETKKDNLVNFCEAVVCDKSGDTFGLKFNVVQKFNCFNVLCDAFPLVNGKITEQFPSLSRPPLSEFNNAGFENLDRMFYLCHKFKQSELLKKDMLFEFGFELLKVYGKATRLINFKLVPFSNTFHTLKYYGCKNADYEEGTYGCNTFGESFDAISDSILKFSFDNLPNVVDEAYNTPGMMNVKLSIVSTYLNNMNNFAKVSIKEVFSN